MKNTTAILALGLLLLFSLTNAFAAPAVIDGLLVYYSFDDFSTSGAGTLVSDGSGHDYDGTVNGTINGLGSGTGVLTSVEYGRFGKAVKFEAPGSSGYAASYVNLPASSIVGIPTSALTAAAWIKTPPTGHQEVFSAFDTSGGMDIHMELRDGGNFRFVLRDYTGLLTGKIIDQVFTGYSDNFGTVAAPIWQHFAISYDRYNSFEPLRIYLNGEKVLGSFYAATPGAVDIGSSWSKAALGTTINDYGRPFVGEMDEFYLFNKALTQEEIKKLVPDAHTATGYIALSNLGGYTLINGSERLEYTTPASTVGVKVAIDVTGVDPVRPVRTINTVLGESGYMTIPYIEPGKYNVAIKPSHWLKYVVKMVDYMHPVYGLMTQNPLVLDMPNNDKALGVVLKPDFTGAWEFINGDIDDSNKVDFSDYVKLQSQYKKLPAGSADLNGDKKVDFADYVILQSSYKKSGDL